MSDSNETKLKRTKNPALISESSSDDQDHALLSASDVKEIDEYPDPFDQNQATEKRQPPVEPNDYQEFRCGHAKFARRTDKEDWDHAVLSSSEANEICEMNDPFDVCTATEVSVKIGVLSDSEHSDSTQYQDENSDSEEPTQESPKENCCEKHHCESDN